MRTATATPLRVCSQGTTAMRDTVATIMKIPKERLRVLTDDVGGAFGLKTGPYPEYVAQLVGAKKFGRPIHWMSGRSEAFLSDNQARDIYSEAELALDDKGRFLALRIRNTCNLGAYVGPVGASIPTLTFARCLPGMYDIKHHRRQRALRVHQHVLDRALSRRRPAGSELRARTRGRGSLARHRHRSGEAAPAQSHSRVGDALQDRGRHHL